MTTLAGNPGSAGTADGTGSLARFLNPIGITVDTGANIYVADTMYSIIRKITLLNGAWFVTTIGGAKASGTADGIGQAAMFSDPNGIAVNSSGSLFVADSGNSRVSMGTVMQPPNLTGLLSASGTEGSAFSYIITADNSPVSYTATGLAPGLSVSASTGLISGAPSASGTFSLGITASNIAGSGSATLTLSVISAYQAWQLLVFLPDQLANPAIVGAAASPAGDGISNLMKYALNLNPLTNGAGKMPFATITPVNGGNYLTLTITTSLNFTPRPDINYTAQVSTDLQTWNSGPGYTAGPSVTPNLDGVTQSISFRSLVPIDSNTPRQFIRLQITGQ